MATVAKLRSKKSSPTTVGEVLDLQEAAEYLKVPEANLIEAVKSQQLPGRAIGGEWRFLKSAIQIWLSTPDRPDFWRTHFGALKDDPFLDRMLEDIYAARGRPMVEDK